MGLGTFRGGESAIDSSQLSEDEIYEVLSNQRRRFVIHALKYQEEPIGLTELSKYVTAWELGISPAEVTYENRRNVYSTLQRTHLPKLDDKDIVIFDQDENVVRQAETLEEVEMYVEVINGKEIPWSLYYVGLTGLTAVLLLAAVIGVPPFAALDPLHIGVFTVTAFTVSSAAHYTIGRHTRVGNTETPTGVNRGE